MPGTESRIKLFKAFERIGPFAISKAEVFTYEDDPELEDRPKYNLKTCRIVQC